MPPTHQRFKDFKELRISLGPALSKLSELSELSVLSVPGSLDCWLPGSRAPFVPSCLAPWLPGSLAPGRLGPESAPDASEDKALCPPNNPISRQSDFRVKGS